MQKRHQDALTERIEAAVFKGFAVIERWELYAWYDKDRIGKTVWRDIRDRFAEIADDDEAELHLYEADDRSDIVLIHSDGLIKISEKIGDDN